ncbi:uncharacterized protein (DUF1330 family) [Chitinophaga niastensis]|uniref:Uncharacterized protein (DUF1330 family) n=1 Tax=Chitinophaga niastensis TaxID=536980 RepID=A0A2P8HP85_CHINA|nr:DUF1330 domain-containing protein [Chitinophaga niastensis]PSL48033.1 uncharacterized protein (DUF1330 family) [Chitinophaga niastensis]
MAVYYINSYDITNMEEFEKYGPPVTALLHKYGAVVLAADLAGIAVEGAPKHMNAIIKFPSEEAALNCYNDPVYQPLKAIRRRSTDNCTMVLVKDLNR